MLSSTPASRATLARSVPDLPVLRNLAERAVGMKSGREKCFGPASLLKPTAGGR